MLSDAIAHAVTALTAAGVRAADDPADLNPPAVWVTPVTWTPSRLDPAAGQAELALYLVVQSTRPTTATKALDQLAQAVGQVFGPLSQLTAVTVALRNHNAGGLPGLRAPLTLAITPED